MGIIIFLSGAFAFFLNLGSVALLRYHRLLTVDLWSLRLLIPVALSLFEVLVMLIVMKRAGTANVFDFYFTVLGFCLLHTLVGIGSGFLPFRFAGEVSLYSSATGVVLLIFTFASVFVDVNKWLGIESTH